MASIASFSRVWRAEKLAPSPEASKEALIRRLSLDLIGLPPTPEEVDAFVADSSEQAYVKVVDRLLSSPHYGERMAVDWMSEIRNNEHLSGVQTLETKLLYVL